MKTTEQKPIRERRVYYFKCGECGKKKAQSFRKRKARKALCRKCRHKAVHEDQQSLFPLPADFDEVRRVPGNPALSGEAAAAFVNASKRKADRLMAKSLTFPVGTSYTNVHGNAIDGPEVLVGLDARDQSNARDKDGVRIVSSCCNKQVKRGRAIWYCSRCTSSCGPDGQALIDKPRTESTYSNRLTGSPKLQPISSGVGGKPKKGERHLLKKHGTM